MSARRAFLFPGQGAQHVGMGEDLCREFGVARRTFAEADEVLGFSLSRLCAEGPEAELGLTVNAQPALLTSSTAIARVLAEEGGLTPAIAAGHSLGEWSALVATGAIGFAEAVAAVRERGRLMQAAVAAGEGAMAALLRAEPVAVERLCRDATRPGDEVSPANLNGGGQIVVAGRVSAVERLEKLAAEAGMRAMRLRVSAPFHCSLMAPARDGMAPLLANLRIEPPQVAVVSNVDAIARRDPDEIRACLLEQITAAVRWEECARAIVGAADSAIEVGPGRILAGLMGRIAQGFPVSSTSDVAGVRSVLGESR